MESDKEEEDKMSNSLSIDITRPEMKWNENHEELLKKWSEECYIHSKNHYKASKKKKFIYYMFQFPIITIPFILGFSSSFYGENHDYNKYVSSFGSMFLGIISGMNAFLNYSKQHIEHENCSNRYSEICIDIESLLVKKKRYRQASDIIIERYTQRIEALNKYSIDI